MLTSFGISLSWWGSGLEMTWIGIIVAVVTYGLRLAFGAVG
jgi:VIT1/CCC1 family predicted Fe2+/Mn2+ transporter